MKPTQTLPVPVASLVLAFLVDARAQLPPIYYIRQVPPQGLQLAQINADGTGDTALDTGLPQPFGPAWSRDGSLLTLTSVNPQRPDKISQDIFLFDLVNTTSRLALQFEDEVKIPPFFENGQLITDRSKFAYRVPIYKALSPDGSRIAVSHLVTSGFYQGGKPDVQTLTGVSQVPQLQVYRLSDGLPQELVVLGVPRTFRTLGGFGVDWHPTQDLLVAPIDVDAPTDGSFLPSESSALFILELVPNALTAGRARRLTQPHGTVRADLPTAPSTLETDYAPAFSPDGQQVAYLRAANTVEFFQGVAQYRPISVAIRAVNFDGSGDRLVLQLSPGIFSAELSWSPDGRQIVFETGQQPAPKPLEAGRFESSPNTLQLNLVNANGTNPHLLRGVSGGLPSWRPATPEDFRINIQLVRGTQSSLVLRWSTQTGGVGVESSPKLGSGATWTREQAPIVPDGSKSRMTLPLPGGDRYYRLVRIP